jgi:hypothetical protein
MGGSLLTAVAEVLKLRVVRMIRKGQARFLFNPEQMNCVHRNRIMWEFEIQRNGGNATTSVTENACNRIIRLSGLDKTWHSCVQARPGTVVVD